MTQQNIPETIPEGYKKNALGHLVPIASIREQDLLRDEVARRVAAKWMELHEKMKALKAETFADVNDIIRISGDKYGVGLGGEKGGVTIATYDGSIKLVRSVADVITFTEEIESAKALIERCLDRWSETAVTADSAAGIQNLRAIAGRAFAKNRNGNLKKNDVLDFLRTDIDDPDWKQAQQAIRDSIHVSGTSTYIRLYVRKGEAGPHVGIPLDIASV